MTKKLINMPLSSRAKHAQKLLEKVERITRKINDLIYKFSKELSDHIKELEEIRSRLRDLPHKEDVHKIVDAYKDYYDKIKEAGAALQSALTS